MNSGVCLLFMLVLFLVRSAAVVQLMNMRLAVVIVKCLVMVVGERISVVLAVVF